jgi:uncharacterized protein (TIGR02001 family)
MVRAYPILFIFLLLAAPAGADVTGYVALTTDYVRRGVSQSGGDVAAQLGADVESDWGGLLGAWASTIDNMRQAGRQHDIELNAYLGYGRDIGPDWRLSAFVIGYFYPGLDTPFSYDYVEYAISANYDDRYWLEYGFTSDYYGTGRNASNIEVFGEWPLVGAWNLGAGIGLNDVSDVVGKDYSYWQVGATGSFRYASVDLRYHDTDETVPFLSTEDTANTRVVLTLTIPF